jgi:hypothetical protein
MKKTAQPIWMFTSMRTVLAEGIYIRISAEICKKICLEACPLASLLVYENVWNIQQTNPYTTLALIPYTITGPAIVNIFAPTPRTKPSACGQVGPINGISF